MKPNTITITLPEGMEADLTLRNVPSTRVDNHEADRPAIDRAALSRELADDFRDRLRAQPAQHQRAHGFTPPTRPADPNPITYRTHELGMAPHPYGKGVPPRAQPADGWQGVLTRMHIEADQMPTHTIQEVRERTITKQAIERVATALHGLDNTHHQRAQLAEHRAAHVLSLANDVHSQLRDTLDALKRGHSQPAIETRISHTIINLSDGITHTPKSTTTPTHRLDELLNSIRTRIDTMTGTQQATRRRDDRCMDTNNERQQDASYQQAAGYMDAITDVQHVLEEHRTTIHRAAVAEQRTSPTPTQPKAHTPTGSHLLDDLRKRIDNHGGTLSAQTIKRVTQTDTQAAQYATGYIQAVEDMRGTIEEVRTRTPQTTPEGMSPTPTQPTPTGSSVLDYLRRHIRKMPSTQAAQARERAPDGIHERGYLCAIQDVEAAIEHVRTRAEEPPDNPPAT